jgi:molecular chaperone DnaK
MAADNKILGQFNLENIPPAPRGVPQIEVGFDIDANGIVSVQARDKGTGKEQKITIQASGGLSDADIERMVKEAETNAEADKARRALVEARNNGESLIHATDKSLKEHGDKVGAEVRGAIEAARDELHKALEGEDAEAIKEKHQALMEASMKLGEAIYKAEADAAQAAQPQPEAPGGEAGPSREDDVVDADFTEVNDDDRKS